MKPFRIKITHQSTEPFIKENMPVFEVGPFHYDNDYARSFSFSEFEILKKRNDIHLNKIEPESSEFVEVYEFYNPEIIP